VISLWKWKELLRNTFLGLNLPPNEEAAWARFLELRSAYKWNELQHVVHSKMAVVERERSWELKSRLLATPEQSLLSHNNVSLQVPPKTDFRSTTLSEAPWSLKVFHTQRKSFEIVKRSPEWIWRKKCISRVTHRCCCEIGSHCYLIPTVHIRWVRCCLLWRRSCLDGDPDVVEEG